MKVIDLVAVTNKLYPIKLIDRDKLFDWRYTDEQAVIYTGNGYVMTPQYYDLRVVSVAIVDGGYHIQVLNR